MSLYTTINEDERGLLIKDGRFKRLLEPGKHRSFDFGSSKIEIFAIKEAEMTSDWARIIEKNHPEQAARLFEIVSTGADELAVVSFDGRPVHLVGPWSIRYFWKVLTDVSTQYINARTDSGIDEKYFDLIDEIDGVASSHIRKTVIEENQRGFLIKNGKFERLLEPGRHFFLANEKERIEQPKFDIKEAKLTSDWAAIIEKDHPELAAQLFEIVKTGEGEVAMVSFNDQPTHLIGPWKTSYFWKVLTNVSTQLIDTTKSIRIDKKHINSLDSKNSSLTKEFTIDQNEAGLLFVDGQFTEQLAPGRHVFWHVDREIKATSYNLLPTPLEISAQEILTKDRITLRVTLTAYVQITDPQKAHNSSENPNEYIYRLVQFAVREAIANRTLDEILNNRQSIDDQLNVYMKENLGDIGSRVTDLGIRDVILPGDMRELINKVVAAEKIAQANLIRRREETAATRALLNTAKLMENNPLLLRLKELESLEKLTEKVGRIDLHTGEQGGFDALVTKLLTLDNKKKDDS